MLVVSPSASNRMQSIDASPRAVFTIDILGQKLHEGCMKFWRPTGPLDDEVDDTESVYF
jgi:hypothetical protein